MKTLEDFKKEAFKREDVRKAYKEFEPEFQVIRALAIARANKKISQRTLAQKIGITQSALARFESGKVSPTLSFLMKVMTGLGLELVVR
jgi:ribosome-binding protein aMBF1 (putative translation factor)